VRPLWAAAVLGLVQLGLRWRYRTLFRRFRRSVGYRANLALPRSYREKTNWRKLFDHNPVFVEMQDKLRAKALVQRLAPELNVPRVLWQGTAWPAEMPDALVWPAVLKASHGCHMNLPLPDRATTARLDLPGIVQGLVQRRWGAERHEWAYGPIEPRVFVEEWLTQASGEPAAEYKVCLAGEDVIHITAESGPATARRFGYYDEAWRRLPVEVGDGSVAEDVPPPARLTDMLAIARRLAAPVDQIRVDFYEVDGELWFGEYTIYSVSGLLPLRPEAVDFEWGARWDLRRSWFFEADLDLPRRLYRAALRAALRRQDRGIDRTGAADRR
jgi:hypothetical protein